MMSEESAHFIQRARDAFAGGIFTDAEGAANIGQAALLKEPQHGGVAVHFGEAIQGGVKEWTNLPPIRSGIGLELVHGESKLFAGFAPCFRAHRVRRGIARSPVQPSGEHDGAGKPIGLARKVDEYDLSDVPRQGGVAVRPAQRCSMHEIDVTRHHFGKGGFGAANRVLAQQFAIIVHSHLRYSRGAWKADKKRMESARSRNQFDH